MSNNRIWRTYSLTNAGKRGLNRWLDAAPSPWILPFVANVLIRSIMREADRHHPRIVLD
jgi:hypothetical protein